MILKKKKEDKIYNDGWIYVLLLTTLAILSESIKNYTFQVASVELSISLFLLPFTYLILNYITKKYSVKKAIASIAISGVIFVCFSAIMSFLVGELGFLSNVAGEFCGYVVSCFMNLMIYVFLLNNTKQPILLVYLNYIFSLLVYYLFYTLIYLNMILLDNYWKGFFITLFLQAIIIIPITIVDHKIKRGREVD